LNTSNDCPARIFRQSKVWRVSRVIVSMSNADTPASRSSSNRVELRSIVP
jgi:hypothetical protein